MRFRSALSLSLSVALWHLPPSLPSSLGCAARVITHASARLLREERVWAAILLLLLLAVAPLAPPLSPSSPLAVWPAAAAAVYNSLKVSLG